MTGRKRGGVVVRTLNLDTEPQSENEPERPATLCTFTTQTLPTIVLQEFDN